MSFPNKIYPNQVVLSEAEANQIYLALTHLTLDGDTTRQDQAAGALARLMQASGIKLPDGS